MSITNKPLPKKPSIDQWVTRNIELYIPNWYIQALEQEAKEIGITLDIVASVIIQDYYDKERG